jgi:spermidine/putrescine transport system ATP-binding protein
MNRGRIMQVGTPAAVYDEPANEFVSSFIGQTNWIEGEVVGTDGDLVVLRLPGGACLRGVARGGPVRGGAVALVRPEKIAVGRDTLAGHNGLSGRVQDSVFLGTVIQHVVATEAGRVTVLAQNTGAGPCAPGADVTLSWEPAHTLIVPSTVAS